MKTIKYKVKLSEEERQQLKNIINNGKNSAKKIKRATILCLLDENQEKVWKQREISEIFQVSTNTIYYIGKQYAEEGLNAVLKRKQRKTSPSFQNNRRHRSKNHRFKLFRTAKRKKPMDITTIG